jgi:hypothetical protein
MKSKVLRQKIKAKDALRVLIVEIQRPARIMELDARDQFRINFSNKLVDN